MSIEAFAEIELEAEEHFEKSVLALANEFQRIRTGRAAPQMVDHVHVLAYGTSVPIRQVASITVPEPTQLLLKPFDKGTLHAIEKALSTADLGMNPQNDGTVIRLNVPPLSSERRKQLAAQAKDACEKCKIAMRNSRRDAIKQIEAKGSADRLPEDLVKQGAEIISELLKTYEAKAEAMLSEKSAAILEL